eukprot:365323-Chlamydomonas_euryale.AAC.3
MKLERHSVVAWPRDREHGGAHARAARSCGTVSERRTRCHREHTHRIRARCVRRKRRPPCPRAARAHRTAS